MIAVAKHSTPRKNAIPAFVAIFACSFAYALEDKPALAESITSNLNSAPRAMPTPKPIAGALSLPEKKPLPYLQTLKRHEVFKPSSYIINDPELTQFQQAYITVRINNQFAHDIEVMAEADLNRVYFEKNALVELLRTYTHSQFLPHFVKYADNRKWIDYRELRRFDFFVKRDPEKFVVNIVIPSQYRAPSEIDLAGHPKQDAEIEIYPSTFSASATARWNRNVLGPSIVNDNVSVNSVMNIANVVAENESIINLKNENFYRRTTKITKDFTDSATRVSVGDIDYNTIGAMGRQRLFGISVGTRYEIMPSLIKNPLIYQPIFVKNDAQIRIYQRGYLYKQLSLKAGYYTLYDFLLGDGVNDVVIEIDDGSGAIETLDYTGYDNKRLLSKGLSEYNIAAGLVSIASHDQNTVYLKKQQAYSVFYKYGVTTDTTFGVMSEGDNNVTTVGLHGLMTSLVGNFEINANSNVIQSNLFRQESLIMGIYSLNWKGIGFSESARWLSTGYRNIGATRTGTNTRYETSTTISFPITTTIMNRFQVRNRELWSTQTYLNASNRISWRVNRYASIQGEVFYNNDYGYSAPETSWMISLNLNTDKYINSSSSYQSKYNTSTTNLNVRIPGLYGSSVSGGMNTNDSYRYVNSGINFNNRFFDSSFNGSVRETNSTKARTTIQSINVASSIALAGGSFALGRPTHNNSFVIAKRKANDDSDFDIGVGRTIDPESMTYLGNIFSNTLMSLGNYNLGRIYVAPESYHSTIKAEKATYDVYSYYRSGSVITINSDYNFFGYGVLMDERNNTLRMQYGTAKHDDGTSVRFFTDAAGNFSIEGLKPGRYQLEMDEETGFAQIHVEEPEENTINIGNVTYTRTQFASKPENSINFSSVKN